MPVSTAKSNEVSATADREIVITRVFNAPRAMVFDTWTDPKHLVHWWGPNGFKVTMQQMDLRPGGDWRMILHGPDGRDYQNNISVLEVEKPKKLVYRHEPTEADLVGHTTTVIFEEKDGGTLVTMHALFPTAEQRAHVVKNYNAIEGGKQHFARLAEYLAMDAKGGEVFEDKTLVLTRVFDAPREMVFSAWTECDHLLKWWGPKGFTNHSCSVDPRTGGSFSIVMRGPDGTDYPGAGTFQEVTPPERIVFTNGAQDKDGSPILDGWSTAVFTEQPGGKTLLTLTTRAIARVPIGKQYIAGMEAGWSQSLEKLADVLA
jgi:uncharacterized protein YndB with AHSA1/START domain